MSTFHCRVVSAKEALFDGQISMLVAPVAQGEIGILPGHTPLISVINPGVLRIKTSEKEEVLYVEGGVLEVQPTGVIVLADSAARAQNLDEAAILSARQNAQDALNGKNSALQIKTALGMLAKSSAQLSAIHKYKNRS